MFYVYVLRSGKTGRRYVGSCEDLDNRVRRHNAGETKATRHGIPWKLVHTESFLTRREAVKKERCYKTDAAVMSSTGSSRDRRRPKTIGRSLRHRSIGKVMQC
jgi:putative endonuclease